MNHNFLRAFPPGISSTMFGLTVLVYAAAASSEEAQFRVNDLMQGKLRIVDDRWNMYLEDKNLDYIPNDVCIYGEITVPCMTYGVRIDYESNSESVTIDCESQAGKSKIEDQFQIELVGTRGSYVHPSSIFWSDTSSDTHKVRTKCFWSGRKVIDYRTTIRKSDGETFRVPRDGKTFLYDSDETGLICAAARRHMVLGGASILAGIENPDTKGTSSKEGRSMLEYGLKLGEICKQGSARLLDKDDRLRQLDKGAIRECGVFAQVEVERGPHVGQIGCIDDKYLEVP